MALDGVTVVPTTDGRVAVRFGEMELEGPAADIVETLTNAARVAALVARVPAPVVPPF